MKESELTTRGVVNSSPTFAMSTIGNKSERAHWIFFALAWLITRNS